MSKPHLTSLRFSIPIQASPREIWTVMLEDRTYRLWTEAFSPGSHFVGNWDEGSRILFLGPGNDGKLSGMVSRIAVNRPHDFLSIEHLGVVVDGVEDTSSLDALEWAGAHENYTFKPLGQQTELLIEIEVQEGMVEIFQSLWPGALSRLKDLVEGRL